MAEETIFGTLEPYGVIYLIENTVNNMRYVGLTKRSIEQRFKEHAKANSYIGRAMRKYGVNNFNVIKIDEAHHHNELIEKEMYWIMEYDTYNNGYNQTIGGDGVVAVTLIKNEYTKLQQRFLKQCEKERYDEFDVNNKHQMVRICLMYTLEAFLLSNTEKDKKEVAKMLFRLRPEYFKSVMDSKIISFKDLKQWV